jgi:hypothetical protein
MSSKKIEIEISRLNAVIKKKKLTYEKLNKRYYLPDINSKACSNRYLQKYILAGNEILKI